MFFDPLYLLLMIPTFILSVGAQIWVKRSFSKYNKIASQRHVSGAQAAHRILKINGINDVDIEKVSGALTDHYDPRSKTLRLSSEVYQSDSLASLGIAAHEAGHAIQHAHGYVPLEIRSLLVPVTNLGSNLAWPLMIIGFLLHSSMLLQLGIIFFGGVVLFQMVTLPVEFNASYRALGALRESGVLEEFEISGSRKVLTAAAMTYVAAAATALIQLIYFLIRAGLIGGNDE